MSQNLDIDSILESDKEDDIGDIKLDESIEREEDYPPNAKDQGNEVRELISSLAVLYSIFFTLSLLRLIHQGNLIRQQNYGLERIDPAVIYLTKKYMKLNLTSWKMFNV